MYAKAGYEIPGTEGFKEAEPPQHKKNCSDFVDFFYTFQMILSKKKICRKKKFVSKKCIWKLFLSKMFVDKIKHKKTRTQKSISKHCASFSFL